MPLTSLHKSDITLYNWDLEGSYSAWKILESAWILFLKFQALESAWK